ncbi:MAG: DNA helicase II / ATP-dependent DNA helicase PcrA [Parcubacteria bacterium C7867-005]|nr:MAG: DNA helicase II / ATP-dependent DNA helicase PcrA [Parcubacteria bacterium C7867-005]
MQKSSLEGLNEKQKEAVITTEGPLLVLAGAGAGKTKTIAERIRHLVRQGVTPSSILAITFTNKAAKEMRERVDRMLGEDMSLNRPVSMSERPFVSTFHALGVHIIKENASRLGLNRHFTIFDKDDSKRAVKEALEKNNLDPKTHDPARIVSIISKEKGRGVTELDYKDRSDKGFFSDIVESVWAEYEKILRRDSALDFDDLLLKTAKLLKTNTEVRKHYQNIWKYVHIDEYQDTNGVQYEISKLLIGSEKNICVVGDIDQNIYSWRGADIKNILDFENDYPGAKIILLEENYRSTKTILDAANAVIEKNTVRRKKTLFTSNSLGDKIGIFQGFDESSEAEFIATKTEALIKSGLKPENIAVLYRANFQSRILEEAFMQHRLPYQMIGTRFFERKEIKDILSYLRASLNPECLSDIKRVINIPARGIGKTTVVKLFTGLQENLPTATKKKIDQFYELLGEIKKFAEKNPPSKTIQFIIRESGLETLWKENKGEDLERLENAYELAAVSERYDELSPLDGVEQLLSDSALQSDQDELSDKKIGVKLMTVHASKGLEFDVVFVSGLEDGLFPHQKITKENISKGEAEEERRLFYVAITRARNKIFLSYAQVRMIFGQREVNIPSEFIFDIPEELTEEVTFDTDNAWKKKPLLEIPFD